MTSDNEIKDNLQNHLKKEIIKDAKRIKNKYPPISEKVNGTTKILTVKKIYKLKGNLNNFILISTKNYTRKPKNRYFLAISLASQSSDLLVNIAKEYSKKNNLKLLQFSLHPQQYRVGLYSLKEIENRDDTIEVVNLLKEFRILFRKDLDNLGKIIERG